MKYFIGVISVILLIFFGYEIFHNVTKKPGTKKTTSTITTPVVAAKSLADWSTTDATVSVTTDGPVVGYPEHRAIRLTIGRTERTMDIMEGYQGLVIKTKSYDNNQSAFDIFLRAIDGAGFTKEQKPKIADERGFCPQGNHYIYELNTGSEKDDKRLWSATCGLIYGTFAGVGPTVRYLFQQQFPDYGLFVANVGLQ